MESKMSSDMNLAISFIAQGMKRQGIGEQCCRAVVRVVMSDVKSALQLGMWIYETRPTNGREVLDKALELTGGVRCINIPGLKEALE